jgi:predicted AlkP superfamily phosphohydrolase/phosphomutase
VLYVAFDACDAGLLLELARQGACPNVASLLKTGAVVDTIAPYGTFVGSSWMTISTGADVGTHRYWNWAEIDPATYALRHTSPRESRRPPFWQHLSDQGRRVAVLDIPHTDMPAEFNGAVIKEWGCHDRHHGTGSYPATLLPDLEARFGRHPYGAMDHPAGHDAFAPCDYTLRAGAHRTREEERRILGAIRRGVNVKRGATLAVLDDGPWDLFAAVHGESHCVGHQLWHVHDERHPRHDPATRALLGDPVVDVYQRLDAALGRYLRRAGRDTVVWFQLNHGMGPHYDGDHVLDELLRRLDPNVADAHRGSRGTAVVRDALEVLPDRVGPLVRSIAARAVRRRADAVAPRWSLPTGAAADRSWFPIPGNTTVGAVRFNLAGREARGVVTPGPELERLAARLTADLLAIVNLDTGRPLVRSVVRSEDVLERSDDDGLPDLFVEWDRSAPIERVWSPGTGTVAARYGHWRTGDHNDRGLVIVRGQGVAAGRRPDPMSLVDVAPTLCATLGAPLPHTDGTVAEHLLPHGGHAPSGRRPARPAHLLGLGSDPRPARVATPAARMAEAALDLAADAVRRAIAADGRGQAARRAVDVERDRIDELTRRIDRLERERAVWATAAWSAQDRVPETELVSVITPTHRRPERLREAIESVLAQRYTNWELVVIDDGGDSAKEVVSEVGDDRIGYLEVPHGGPCAARNAGLDLARGSLVVYLDDDNRLDAGWLQAVVRAFADHPEHGVLYGARVIDDEDRVHGRGAGGWPWLQFAPYDRAVLEQGNIADMGVVAHRAGIPGARFDETFWECGDWDFLLSVTEDHDPLEVPAIAFYYRTDGDDRLTGRFVHDEARVREKWARRRAERDGPSVPLA